jgi:hypothetical protein
MGPPGYCVKPELRATSAVVGSVVAFAVLIEPAGLLPAAFASAAIVALGAPPVRARRALWVAGATSVLIGVLLVAVLGLPLRLIAGP